VAAVCSVCEEFEHGVSYDEEVIKNARLRFRERTNPILSKSHLINRMRTWPQGHQGDYKTLEAIYQNTPLSEGIGYYLDALLLSSTLAVGVRERIEKFCGIIRQELMNRQNPRVLDIACNSCREVFELAPEIEKSGALFTCIDLDSEALTYSFNRLSYANLSSGGIEFLKYDALRMLDQEMNIEEFGRQDVIYTVGFFDYLPDGLLVKLLNALYQLLKPGGKLIASFKDARFYKTQLYHWIIDWDGFLQRSKGDFEHLFSQAGIQQNALSLSRVRSDVITFCSVSK